MPSLPASTDARLLAAIPQMLPWSDASKNNRWVLRESGKQLLVYSRDSSPLDLSAETGTFHVHVIDRETGAVDSDSQTIQAGGNVTLPAGIVWLTRD
jgi:hypothetical protein